MSFVAVCSLHQSCQQSFNFINAFACYKRNCKLARFNLANPVLFLSYNYLLVDSLHFLPCLLTWVSFELSPLNGCKVKVDR